MCTPPSFRYKGNNLNKAKSLLTDVMKRNAANNNGSDNNNPNNSMNMPGQPLSTAKKGTPGGPNSSSLPLSSSKKNQLIGSQQQSQQQPFNSREIMKLESIQKSVRIAIRSYSGITSLVQLIHYKKNQFYILHIRLETIRVLIGIAHNQEIKLILFKMRIPIILENQMKNENNQDLLLINGNSSSTAPPPLLTSKLEKELLMLYSDCLIKLLTKSTMEDHGITDENIDASQEILDRKAIVEHSHVSLLFSVSFLHYFF